MNKLWKEDESVLMTIRISEGLQDEYSRMAEVTGLSRNELICKALKFALENLEISSSLFGEMGEQ